MRKLGYALALAALMTFAAAPASADLKEGVFNITLDAGGLFTGTGDGYTTGGDPPGPWFEYPSGWINQWWYDDPPDPDRWKEVTVTFNYQLLDPLNNGGADIAINYSTLEFPESGPDGEAPMYNEDPGDPSII